MSRDRRLSKPIPLSDKEIFELMRINGNPLLVLYRHFMTYLQLSTPDFKQIFAIFPKLMMKRYELDDQQKKALSIAINHTLSKLSAEKKDETQLSKALGISVNQLTGYRKIFEWMSDRLSQPVSSEFKGTYPSGLVLRMVLPLVVEKYQYGILQFGEKRRQKNLLKLLPKLNDRQMLALVFYFLRLNNSSQSKMITDMYMDCEFLLGADIHAQRQYGSLLMIDDKNGIERFVRSFYDPIYDSAITRDLDDAFINDCGAALEKGNVDFFINHDEGYREAFRVFMGNIKFLEKHRSLASYDVKHLITETNKFYNKFYGKNDNKVHLIKKLYELEGSGTNEARGFLKQMMDFTSQTVANVKEKLASRSVNHEYHLRF